MFVPDHSQAVQSTAHANAVMESFFSTVKSELREEIEKLAIVQTLERTRGNKRKAASILGVYRPTLYNKLKKYHLMETHDRPVVTQPSAGVAAPALAEGRKPGGE